MFDWALRLRAGFALQCDEQLATSRLLFLAEFLESGIGAQKDLRSDLL